MVSDLSNYYFHENFNIILIFHIFFTNLYSTVTCGLVVLTLSYRITSHHFRFFLYQSFHCRYATHS